MEGTKAKGSVVLASVLALGLVACTSPDVRAGGGGVASAGSFAATYDGVVAAAAEEDGPVSLCTTWSEGEFQAIRDEFNAKYPDVELEFTRCTGIESRERALTEMRTGHVEYDLIDVADELLQRFVDLDVLATPPWEVFKGSPLKIDPRFIAERYKGQIGAAGSWSSVIAYNPELVPIEDVPKSFTECTEPGFRGRILVDTRPQSFLVFYDVWNPERLRALAKSLAANEPTWVRGASDILPAVASGEHELFCGVQQHSVTRLMSENPGINLDFVLPAETNSNFLNKLAIAKDTAVPNSTLLFLAYMVSNDGQIAMEKANVAYGSPLVQGTQQAQMFEEAGAVAHSTGWNLPDYADQASELIIEEWGFPQPKFGE